MSALLLYRQLLRESNGLAYNFKEYAKRNVRARFRENMHETDPSLIKQQIAEAESNLEILKRQAIITSLYGAEKLVVEGGKTGSDKSGEKSRGRDPQGWD